VANSAIADEEVGPNARLCSGQVIAPAPKLVSIAGAAKPPTVASSSRQMLTQVEGNMPWISSADELRVSPKSHTERVKKGEATANGAQLSYRQFGADAGRSRWHQWNRQLRHPKQR
jgi:hypothetical protein